MSTEMDTDVLLGGVKGKPHLQKVQRAMLDACLQGGVSIESLMEYLVLKRHVPIKFVICDIKCANKAIRVRALQFARLGDRVKVAV